MRSALGALVIAGAGLLPLQLSAQPVLSFGASLDQNVLAGDQVGLRILVTNLGAGVLTSVSVSLQPTAPGGATFEVDPPEASCSTTACAFGDLAPGQGRSLRLAVSTLPGICGTVASGTVQLTSGNGGSGMVSVSTQVRLLGDANADCAVNVSDVLFLINFLFAGGPAPG